MNTLTYKEFLEYVVEEVNNRINGRAVLKFREIGLTANYDIVTSFNDSWFKVCISCCYTTKIWNMYEFYLDDKERKADCIDRCVMEIVNILKQEVIRYYFKVGW